MVFDSLLDAWGIALGLRILTIMWDILVHSGLVTLSIAALFISNTKSLLEQGYSDELFNSVILNLLLIVAVWAFAVLPWATFKVTDIKTYSRHCDDPRSRVSRAISTNDSPSNERVTQVFEKQLDLVMEGEKIQVPPLIYVTLALSQAFKNEAINRLPCATDINLIESEVSNSKLSGHLLENTNEFIKWCYWPARNKARREGIFPGEGILPEELHMWPGHPFFIETVGYYDNAQGNGHYAKEAFYGFSATSNKIIESKKLPVGYGYPTCKEWWLGIDNDTTYGLRHQLFRATPNWLREEEESFYAYVSSWFNSSEYEESYIDRRDAIIKKVFFSYKEMSDYTVSQDYGLEEGETNLIDYLSRFTGTVGVGLSALGNTVGTSMIHLMAPMVKPLIILVILTAYMPAMLIGRFKVKHVTTFLTVIASVMFWPFLWELGRLVDDTILDATGGVIFGGMGINQVMLSQYLAGFFFLYGPMLFTAAMGWVGMAGGEMASAKQRMSSTAGSAGNKGVSVAKSTANNASGKIKQAASKRMSR